MCMIKFMSDLWVFGKKIIFMSSVTGYLVLIIDIINQDIDGDVFGVEP